LEGLEISIQNYKELETIIDYRIEAEYFDKRFLKIDSVFEQQNYVNFFEVADYENGRAYSSEEFYEGNGGVKVAKIGDVTQKRPNANWSSVSNEEFNKQKGHYLVDNDILMTLTGDPPDVGKVNLFVENKIKSTWNQRVARIFLKKKQNSFLNQKVLFIVLSTRYCREQLERYAKGIRQRNLGTECIEKLKLPILGFDIQNKINDYIANSFEKLTQSQSLYRQAEELLSKAVFGGDDCRDAACHVSTATPNVNIKTLSASFFSTGRLDAEYYQTKYEEMIDAVRKQNYDLLVNLVNIKKSIEPGSDVYSDEGIPFIRVSDFNKFGISTTDKYLSDRYFKENEAQLTALFPQQGTILFSKDGSVGTACLVQENLQAVTSGALLHLTVKDKTRILPEYLTLALNSPVVQQQAERDAGGSIILHWRINEIEQVLIPLVDFNIQTQIATLIRQSFALRRECETLLNEAKEMVEREIEKGQ
jgi:restriction endonuclease S subunit